MLYIYHSSGRWCWSFPFLTGSAIIVLQWGCFQVVCSVGRDEHCNCSVLALRRVGHSWIAVALFLRRTSQIAMGIIIDRGGSLTAGPGRPLAAE